MIDWTTSIADYHAREHVSASKLSEYASKGAAYYHAKYIARRYEEREEQSDALRLGQAFEDLLQRPDYFDAAYIAKPEGHDGRTKAGKEWALAHANKTLLSQAELHMMQGMARSVRGNSVAMAMIEASHDQGTLTFEWPGVPGVQSRPDWICADGCAETGYSPFTLDLKTTATFSKLTSGRGVGDWGYHRQAALAREAMAKNGIPYAQCYLLAIEKTRPYRCQVLRLSEEWLDSGWRWCADKLRRLADHYTSGLWPLVNAEMAELPPPPPWLDARGYDDEVEVA